MTLGGPRDTFLEPARSWGQGTYSRGLCFAVKADGVNWPVPKNSLDTGVPV